MTRVRLPTTPVPAPTAQPAQLDGAVSELVGLVVSRDDQDGIAARVQALLGYCDSVIVVDDGSQDDTADRAEEAGARVLRFPAPRGEGAALRAGMQLGRELSYIGAVWTGDAQVSPEGLHALALAHVRAPEALVMGVGPGEALAGKEWDEARAVAEGREPEPYPEWRPPKADGWSGRVETWFEKLVETRYSYPWGGPRVLPLQSVLRRDLQEFGQGVHLEILALGVVAGIPTVEVELPESPDRPVVTCRRTAVRLLSRLVPMTFKVRTAEKFGLGGGYAPPTNSPLQLLLSAALAVALALAASGCPKPVALEAPTVACEEEVPRTQWPGNGDAAVALAQLLQSRSELSTIWAEQGVAVDDPQLDGPRKLRGVLVLRGADELRLRLLAPMGMTVMDYVEVEGRWQLSVPPAGLLRSGGPSDPVVQSDELESGASPLQPELLASLVRSVQAGATVRWEAGRCAVLEELSDDGVVRRLVFRPAEVGWEVAGEELLVDGEVRLAVAYEDYRPVGEAGLWPHRSRIEDRLRGSRVVLETRKVRTEGVTDAFFAMQDP